MRFATHAAWHDFSVEVITPCLFSLKHRGKGRLRITTEPETRYMHIRLAGPGVGLVPRREEPPPIRGATNRGPILSGVSLRNGVRRQQSRRARFTQQRGPPRRRKNETRSARFCTRSPQEPWLDSESKTARSAPEIFVPPQEWADSRRSRQKPAALSIEDFPEKPSIQWKGSRELVPGARLLRSRSDARLLNS